MKAGLLGYKWGMWWTQQANNKWSKWRMDSERKEKGGGKKGREMKLRKVIFYGWVRAKLEGIKGGNQREKSINILLQLNSKELSQLKMNAETTTKARITEVLGKTGKQANLPTHPPYPAILSPSLFSCFSRVFLWNSIVLLLLWIGEWIDKCKSSSLIEEAEEE